jgi:anti-anti-sigma factor
MQHTFVERGDEIEISLQGKFTFADNAAFASVLEGISNRRYKSVIINLEGVEFIDSAALGILLLARDRCDSNSVGIVLKNPTGHVKQMLKVSKFHEMFNIIEKDESKKEH